MIRLEEQHKEQTEKKAQAIKEMKNIENKRKKIIDEGKGNKAWKTFFDFLEKVKFDIYTLQDAFERTKIEQAEKYEENKDIFAEFIAYIEPEIEYLQNAGKIYTDNKNKRDEANHVLSHKSNWINIEDWLIKTKSEKEKAADWTKRTNMENRLVKSDIEINIEKEIAKIFRKTDHMGHLIDSRHLKEMFTSIIATELISSSKTDDKTKKQLIRNHTDKLGLLNHLQQLYDK